MQPNRKAYVLKEQSTENCKIGMVKKDKIAPFNMYRYAYNRTNKVAWKNKMEQAK